MRAFTLRVELNKSVPYCVTLIALTEGIPLIGPLWHSTAATLATFWTREYWQAVMATAAAAAAPEIPDAPSEHSDDHFEEILDHYRVKCEPEMRLKFKKE